jgi:hypothetical protein
MITAILWACTIVVILTIASIGGTIALRIVAGVMRQQDILEAAAKSRVLELQAMSEARGAEIRAGAQVTVRAIAEQSEM